MAIEFKKTSYAGNLDAFWRTEVRMLPGGFNCSQSIPVGDVIPRGALVCADFDTMTATIVKVGRVVDGGTTTKPRVTKNNHFYAGDTVMKIGKKDAAVTVKSVDRSNPDYDVVEFSAALATLAKGDYLIEAVKDTGDSATTYSQAHEANTILGADYTSRAVGMTTLDVAYSAVALKDVCPQFPADWLDGGAFLKTNHNILFIKQ
nr:MAG TPA: Head fiber protein [Caudoviricetes sp.]